MFSYQQSPFAISTFSKAFSTGWLPSPKNLKLYLWVLEVARIAVSVSACGPEDPNSNPVSQGL